MRNQSHPDLSSMFVDRGFLPETACLWGDLEPTAIQVFDFQLK